MLTPQQKAAIARAPERYRKVFTKALQGSSLRAAVTAKCLECCAFERRESGIDRIKDCTSQACPLYPKRPYQQRSSTDPSENSNPTASARMAAARAAKRSQKP
jgi:hypothetical protein